MKLKPIGLKKGKVYFIAFGESTQLTVRYEKHTVTRHEFISELKIYNGKESFFTCAYCVRHGITELRAATKEETAKLVKYEAENDVQYFLTDKEKDPFTRCETCKSKSILMTGVANVEADDEPYQKGKYEDAEVQEVEFVVIVKYCPKCKEPIDIWHE
jgi:hypothetical protein